MSATVDRNPAFDLAALRVAAAGREPWRSMDELADTAEFQRFVEAEFPAMADPLQPGFDRRTVLKLMGASLSLAGLAACSEAESIVPYVRQPENIIPGRPLYYATALSSDGYGIGAVIESHEGRPTKVEGNPDHPASRGATDAVMQAAVLSLFDPERSRTPLKLGEPASYDEFLKDIAELAGGFLASGGQGLALLLEATTSPTTKAQIAALRVRYPRLRVFRHDPLAANSGEQATGTLFGRPLTAIYRFDRADVIVSLDADFLGDGPGRLAYARDFAQRRRVRKSTDTMSRLYVVETTPTITGAAADHRRAIRPSAVASVAAAIKAALDGDNAAVGLSPLDPEWINALVDDLRSAGRNALVVPGAHQAPFVHALAFAMNARLGALGNTLQLIEPPDAMPADGDLATLCGAITDGSIDKTVVLGANPLHTAPSDLDARKAFSSLKLLVHWGLYRDETAFLARWHIPAAHELESWSDIRAYDGTVSIVQPLIEPLFGGKSLHQLLAALGGEFGANAQAPVRRTWVAMDEVAWRKALRDGIVPNTAAGPAAVSAPPDSDGSAPNAATKGLEVRFVADPWLRDGRHANSSWLQELPRPLSKLVWGNAALVSPATAQRLGLENGQVVNLARDGRTLDAPVWITPGQPDDTVTLSLGFGRKAGSVAALAGGYDAFAIRTSDAPWFADDVVLSPRGGSARVVTTQHHQAMEGRAIIRHASLDAFRANPHFVRAHAPPAPVESLYPDWSYDQEAWGMSIDLSACIGCMACVSACQAENNIATVGPDEAALGHEMHWLRVDRYYAGGLDDPDMFFQPVPCMHCEKAPCEVVCPVNATIHTHDGLNAQVYNRCIGTRYCSQNCPYKVRRFNFLEYQEFDNDSAGPEQAVHNPDVTVRSRGVMEKCSYCVQRISQKRIRAQIENREIEDGEIVTACQQACPTKAITFGDLNRKDSQVVQEKASPHNYALLEELNTRPRTTYLGKVSNPNDRLAATSGSEGGDG
ncbi:MULTISPECIES: TAT-variant-translocated molybdopterin oxidoreductase [unclassified Mesorhizobium]|uniref:TAT-variant-translocated molybdopterin oxidoreductase n=1 Tax=unclassified Mesorhizobium TaxID=325217 RepID=UPI00112D065C|nr:MULTISPECIES: TAT-variant-translocated molybdopterin oxidoreductase [unclassified Mesorhizobium]TPK42591.1 4Fe-4S dicluster domain-containing protein [Mesorhizobium sp. B2-5-2]TPL24750.1 4Fe-4S dicluster domain-containing protein [Mesorhizobium sp. B2-4-9]TPL26711.1 4Fe-4S dicluster domain-containing protein [Mesorhizobium sp. B2-4-7]TPL40489.1 4Fe-4S dicluster domain-containing protein [Mesorhizobium sp. B2-4-5]TPM76763.1 4Fe-4S dicluster domain-containing protein [Mesorhizobium sp. B2-1-6